jgi:putative ATPase
MKSMEYGKGYVYPHDTPLGYVPGVEYLPVRVAGRPFYEPSERGNEKTIRERIEWLRSHAGKGRQ